MNRKRALRLIDEMDRAVDQAARAYQRYSWSPASETGRKALRAHDDHLSRYERKRDELKELLAAV